MECGFWLIQALLLTWAWEMLGFVIGLKQFGPLNWKAHPVKISFTLANPDQPTSWDAWNKKKLKSFIKIIYNFFVDFNWIIDLQTLIFAINKLSGFEVVIKISYVTLFFLIFESRLYPYKKVFSLFDLGQNVHWIHCSNGDVASPG